MYTHEIWVQSHFTICWKIYATKYKYNIYSEQKSWEDEIDKYACLYTMKPKRTLDMRLFFFNGNHIHTIYHCKKVTTWQTLQPFRSQTLLSLSIVDHIPEQSPYQRVTTEICFLCRFDENANHLRWKEWVLMSNLKLWVASYVVSKW